MIVLRYALLLFFIFYNSSCYTRENILRMAYFDMPPHMVKTDNPLSPKGSLVEYFEKYIQSRMGVKIKWVGPYSSFLRMIEEVGSDKYDTLSLVTNFPKSEKIVKFSRRPIYHGTPSLILLAGHKLNEVKNDKDIIGLNIAHFKFLRKYYFKMFKQKKVVITEITGVDWFERSISMLMAKRVDAVYVPETPPIKLLMKEKGFSKKLKVISLPIKKNQFFTMFSNKMKNQDQVILNYDKALNESPISYDQFLRNKLFTP